LFGRHDYTPAGVGRNLSWTVRSSLVLEKLKKHYRWNISSSNLIYFIYKILMLEIICCWWHSFAFKYGEARSLIS